MFDHSIGRIQKIFRQGIFRQRYRIAKPQEQEKIFNLYEVRFGKEIVDTLGHAILSLYARLLGIDTPVDFLGFNIDLNSEEDLTKDLNNDPIISQTMGHLLSELFYKYGVYLSPLTATLITTKHLSINKNASIIKYVDGRSNADSSTQ